MSKPGLTLIGAGGRARSCIEVIEQHGQFQIAGLVGMPEQMHAQHLGCSVIATDGDLLELAKAHQYAFVTIGQIQAPDNRMRPHQRAAELGFRLPVVIAPTARVSRHATIGAGSMVMHGVEVNARARVGINCIINTCAVLEHDATVDDHCHMSTGAVLNGDVHIGGGSFVGSGRVIKEGVSIRKRCLVGMGVSARHSRTDHARLVGNDQA